MPNWPSVRRSGPRPPSRSAATGASPSIRSRRPIRAATSIFWWSGRLTGRVSAADKEEWGRRQNRELGSTGGSEPRTRQLFTIMELFQPRRVSSACPRPYLMRIGFAPKLSSRRARPGSPKRLRCETIARRREMSGSGHSASEHCGLRARRKCGRSAAGCRLLQKAKVRLEQGINRDDGFSRYNPHRPGRQGQRCSLDDGSEGVQGRARHPGAKVGKFGSCHSA